MRLLLLIMFPTAKGLQEIIIMMMIIAGTNAPSEGCQVSYNVKPCSHLLK